MGELAINHHRDNLHIPVGMHAESVSSGNGVIVDHTQGAESQPIRAVVIREREAVPGVQPLELAVEAFRAETESHRDRVTGTEAEAEADVPADHRWSPGEAVCSSCCAVDGRQPGHRDESVEGEG